jgi:hypothetical protein
VSTFEHIITDSENNHHEVDFHLTNESFGITCTAPFSLTHQILSGGKQQGSELLTLTQGDMTIRFVPTRAMAILDVVVAGTRFGWDSSVKEVVNPAFINQEAFGGLGWLEGFNEMVVRCGYQWAGHPGVDGEEMLTLHGRIQNTPASFVKLTVDQSPPHNITLSARVDEKCFKKSDFEVWMHVSVTPGENKLVIRDELINRGDYEREYQVIYHNNFGTPVLDAGGQLHVPAKSVSPFNEYAKQGLASWDSIDPPRKGFDEMVFNVFPISDEQGNTTAVLHNAQANKGVAVGYNTSQLPVLTIWKNLDTPKQGYVVGIEPGTSFAYNRRYQRALGLVPTIGANESREFDVSFTFLMNEQQVASQVADVICLQHTTLLSLDDEPLVTLPS